MTLTGQNWSTHGSVLLLHYILSTATLHLHLPTVGKYYHKAKISHSNFTKKDHFTRTHHIPINSVFMDFWTNKNKRRKVEFKSHKKDCSVKRGLWHTAVFSVSILYFYHTRKEKPCSQVCSKLLHMSLVIKNLNIQKICALTDRHKMEGSKEMQFLNDNKLYHNTHTGRNIL